MLEKKIEQLQIRFFEVLVFIYRHRFQPVESLNQSCVSRGSVMYSRYVPVPVEKYYRYRTNFFSHKNYR
jgi:hypothetical protein